MPCGSILFIVAHDYVSQRRSSHGPLPPSPPTPSSALACAPVVRVFSLRHCLSAPFCLCFCRYGGYVLLFGRLFHTSYFGRRAQNVKHKRGGSAAKGEGEQATAKQGESSSSSVLSPLTRAQSSVFEALKEE